MAIRVPAIGVLIVAAALPVGVRAQAKLTLAPSASVSAISDDNIFSTSTQSSDQTTLVTPGIQGALDVPRASLVGGYTFDMLRSADFAALNNLEARRHGMLGAHYQQTPRLALDASGHYDRSDEAGELNFETGVLLPRRRATRWEAGPSFTYRASPVVTLHGQYNWVQESLEDAMLADEHVGRFSIARQLSERSSLSAGYIGRHFINGDETQTSHAALVGATYALGPFTTLTLQGGPRRSSARQLEPEIVASLGRRAPNLIGYAINYWRGESIILGVLGPVEVTSATGRFTMPLRRNLEVGAATGLFTSDSLIQGQARVYHSEVVASWSPGPFYAVGASYGADFQHGDIRTSLLNERDIVRHVFLVGITVAPRLSRVFKQPGRLGPLAGEPDGVNRD
jgi:hypothetical protein